MPRQTIGVFPVFVSFTQARVQVTEEGNCYLSMDYIYHSNSLPV